MVDDDEGGQIVSGRVKWFDVHKGFGFIVAEGGGADILLHANVLRNFGQSSVADGARIVVAVQQTARGAQAYEVRSIAPPDPEPGDPADIDDEAAPAPEGPLLPARVKWFDKAKGFGFANVFGRSEDVFVHIEVLRRSSLAELQPGEAVALRVTEGARGRLATQVATWESALTDKE
ncbi:cold shock domain-containing protein [Rhodobacteraceae bacterium CCMM004]|nr:cold shock domain-containing protein [Rhodobacteraceae bacterium CCMM004]